MVAHVKNILETQNVKCMIRNQYISAALGEIPVNECWPELYIVDPGQIEKAKEIIKEITEPNTENFPAWVCPTCHEIIEGQFTACWNCAAKREV